MVKPSGPSNLEWIVMGFILGAVYALGYLHLAGVY